MLHLFASALLLASTAQAALYAGSSAERYTAFNSTLKVAFTVENGEGVMTDGLRLLQGANGTNSTGNSTLYGVLLQFNETIGTNANGSSSGIPFVALVNCDYSPSAAVLNSTANSTTNSTSPSNSTSSSNSTTNGTSTAEVDVFRLAASLDAIAILLYSSQNESCTLNSTYNATSSIPIYSIPSQSDGSILLSQFDNVDAEHQFFNSSLLIEASANLTGFVQNAGAGPGALPDTGFLLAQISPRATNNTSPVVATIGRAPTSTSGSSSLPPATGTAPEASATGPSSGASGSGSSLAATAALGLALVVGAWVQL